MSTSSSSVPHSQHVQVPPLQVAPGQELEPAWDIARLFPPQGKWSEFDYLALTESTNQLVELTDGRIEVLEMPTAAHQRILLFLYRALYAFVSEKDLGEVLTAAFRIRIRANTFREPDIVFIAKANAAAMKEEYWEHADLVIEVVSKDDKSQKRDHVTKRADYANAGIAEYWIVDPQESTVTVLTLDGQQYQTHGQFKSGEQAGSNLLTGFQVDVEATFDAGKTKSS